MADEEWEVVKIVGTDEEATVVVGFLQSSGIEAMAESLFASEFPTDFGDVAQRTAETMLADGLLHVLASDTHGAVHRPPTLLVDGGLDPDEHEWMTTTVPEAIVAGRAVPPRPLRSSSAR